MKSCKKCGQSKNDKERCNNCVRQYYQNNKKEKLLKQNLYNKNNKKIISESKKIYYNDNKESILDKNKQYYLENMEKIRLYSENYYIDNKGLLNIKKKIYNEINKEKIRTNDNAYKKRRRETDINYKLRRNCSAMIWRALNGTKNASILNYLPYTMEDLKIHLEKQFDNKMSWNNYGNYWHLDHICPQSKLPYVSMEDDNFKKCWALDNLQPLEATENRKKSNKAPNV